MSLSDETRRIIELLRHHHSGNYEWASFVELRNGTGSTSNTAIDFFAIHTWPSKQFHAVSYEIKVSRSDFIRELNNPLKRAFAESVSNESFFVVPHGLMRVDEIPEGWGLMVANAGGLKTLKRGTQRKEVKWSKSFTVSLARRSADPPPALPHAAWKVAGKEIGEDQLIAIAEQALNKRLLDQEDKLRDEGYAKGREAVVDSIQYQRMTTLQAAVAKVIGTNTHFASAEHFERWLAESKPAAHYWIDVIKVQRAYALLQEALAAEGRG